MKQRSAKEVAAIVAEIWGEGDESGVSRGAMHEWRPRPEGGGTLDIWSMYGPPSLTLDHLMQLARFFDTVNVGSFGDIDDPGCHSCDYGSRRGFELEIADGPSPPGAQ